MYLFLASFPLLFSLKLDVPISLLYEYSCVLKIQEVLLMPVCDWYTGARSGWTGSSVVGVHCRVFEGVGHQTNPSGCVCACVGLVIPCMLLIHS